MQRASKKTASQPRVALVHDYLREYGGAERVMEALHALYPQAPVYVGFVDWQALGQHAERFKDWDIRETFLGSFPGIRRLHSPLRILAPWAFRSLDLSNYEVVISSSNAYFAKAARTPQGKHLCYCHTPPRALYGYNTLSDWRRKPLLRLLGGLLNSVLRPIDYRVAQRVDVFIANSRETQARIKRFYGRESTIVHPPVALPRLSTEEKQARWKALVDHHGLPDKYYLYVNRLAFAKHPELAVAACTQAELPLVVVGEGALREELEAEAGPSVHFLGGVSDAELVALYQRATALLYPVEDEDFGMVPVESLQAGVPVIAHASGGPLETIEDGETGLLFSELSVEALLATVRKAESITFDRQKLRQSGQAFEPKVFAEKIERLVGVVDGKK